MYGTSSTELKRIDIRSIGHENNKNAEAQRARRNAFVSLPLRSLRLSVSAFLIRIVMVFEMINAVLFHYRRAKA
jgi:hypothetical protein